MKMTMKLRGVLLALAGGALLATAVSAAPVVANPGDLILGFRAESGMGSGFNLEVNLGSISNFYNAAPGTVFNLTGLVIQDLKDTYGENWYERTDLFWGAAAHYSNGIEDPNGKPACTLWVTDVADPVYKRASASSQAPPGVKIQGLYSGGPGQLNGAPSTTNSPVAAVINNTQSGSWSAQSLPGGWGNSFGYFNPRIDGAIGSVKTLTLVELLPYAPLPKIEGDKLGTLTLSTEGLMFQAIPEPSTGLLIGLGLCLSLMARRWLRPRRF